MRDYILEIFFDDPSIEELIQSRLFLSASTGSVTTDRTISAYFDAPEDRAAAMEAMRDIDGIEMIPVERDRLDWLEIYQQSLEPIVIGMRFVVAPDAALLPRDSDRLTIVVPQEQAFGTGSHESTAMCLELLETLDLAGKCTLDVGSGSGILAIAMLRLGAQKVIAFDNDPDAYGALRDNRIRNRIDISSMPVFIGSVEALRAGAFDAATMNIVPEVILPLLPDVVSRLADGAHLILSGVITSRRDNVVDGALAHGLEAVQERVKVEWWAGLFRRVM